jgi:uncharacterized membrane protein YphA (DoxX/SURF4 family)
LADARRQLGTSAVLALVLLRLVIGGHFFSEGTSKVAYDRTTGSYQIAFSAEGFLSQAKGPLASLYRAQVPQMHDWQGLLAVPRANRPLADDEAAERAAWDADYQRQLADAAKAKKPAPIEFPPYAPYYGWARQIVNDWKATLADVTAIQGLTDAERRKAGEAFVVRHQQLADYLAEESAAMVDYQNELARLEQWQATPEADGVPFMQDRIKTKTAETTATAKPWVAQVGEFEQNYNVDLRHATTSGDSPDANLQATVDSAVIDSQTKRLGWINLGATVLTLGVGICLLAGLFTRTASIVGALFLLSVIVSQPPWIPDAQSTIYQAIEFVALLVLAATAAGRWFGLDYITYALFGRKEVDA